LNLKDEADRNVFLSMVRRADVLAEKVQPSMMARLGFAHDDLSKINPRLVYASVSGFGQTGPLSTRPSIIRPQARNMLIEVGRVKMAGNPIKMSTYPDPQSRGGTPTLEGSSAAS
jgi:hypothetical protein